jgi:hypothetical protein
MRRACEIHKCEQAKDIGHSIQFIRLWLGCCVLIHASNRLSQAVRMLQAINFIENLTDFVVANLDCEALHTFNKIHLSKQLVL